MGERTVCYTGNCVAHNDSRTRIVTVYGNRVINHVLFLARMFHSIGKCVLVVDNSGDGELGKCIVMMPDESGSILHRGVTYCFEQRYDERLFQQYDVVIVACGLCRDDVLESVSNQVYLYTDFQKYSSSQMMELASHISIPYAVVYMDCVQCDYAQPNYIEFGFREAAKNIQKRYFLPLSAKDYTCGLMMQYTGRFNIHDFSNEYQDMLYLIVHSLFPEYTTERLKKQYVV